ncbi:MAG: replication initiation factor domain-containing protein, partial [Myxococcota bacterium]
LAGGLYPKGATLAHGSRDSENYARQYDKHLEQAAKGLDPGPPRRRDEVELKGATAQAVWQELLSVLNDQMEQARPNWMAEAAFSKGLIRHYLPIRDTSQWEGKELPKNWAGTAVEPAWWAKHFSQEAIRARRERGPSSTLLKRIGYMNRTFGSLYTQQFVLEQLKSEQIFDDVATASEHAQCVVRDRMFSNAKDYRLDELLENLPQAQHKRATEIWWSAVRAAADGDEAEREIG